MLYLLDASTFCRDTATIWQFIGWILFVFKIVIPLLLILFGMIDLGKKVEKNIRKNTVNGVDQYYVLFNFRNIHEAKSFPTLEEGIEKVIEVDQDDEKYMKILMTPKLKSESYLDDLYIGLKQFLFQIFDQEKEDAYRRLRFYVHRQDV